MNWVYQVTRIFKERSRTQRRQQQQPAATRAATAAAATANAADEAADTHKKEKKRQQHRTETQQKTTERSEEKIRREDERDEMKRRGPGSIPNNWADVCGFLNRPMQIGRYACTVLFSIHAKLSACVQPIKATIMRHGSTWISSIGAIPNHITKNLTDEFYSKSVLRQIIKASRKGASAISPIRSLRDRATIRVHSSILCENLYILTK